MIWSVTGILEKVFDGSAGSADGAKSSGRSASSVVLRCGKGLPDCSISLQVLIPASDVQYLQSRLGQPLVLFTLCYMEGDASRGNLEPRLIGFLREEDRAFFELFTTVKGVGVKTALRALSVPVGQIAAAIERKDARMLVALDGIGKRTAELVVAELHGKAGRFVGMGIQDVAPGSGRSAPTGGRSRAMEDAIMGLISLGERRDAAEQLADAAADKLGLAAKSEDLLREMLLRRGG